MTLEEKWNSLEEVAARYYYLSAKKMNYHPCNTFSVWTDKEGKVHSKSTMYDYDKHEFVTMEW